ncbi:ATPase [Mycolicibacterium fortuitum subsp. acetamidolyticum]|uniref:ATPase n=1 Tax=Mycolicibacterium fortuitum subsp. acetamidolyticum TaxID=144550 RepID=A0A100WPB0_MYCFO|nr:hypothetical protein [Mycolicibacterium fortuitum]GAT01605.1 ATPase [Mycolicibacterium fortuitum subsp. acetamidolyticum]
MSPDRAADPADEEDAIRFVQKQFKEAGFDCPRDTALEVVQHAWDQVR